MEDCGSNDPAKEREQDGKIAALREWAVTDEACKAATEAVASNEGQEFLACAGLYRRFLIAREWDITKSQEMLKAHLEWRQQMTPSLIKESDLAQGVFESHLFVCSEELLANGSALIVAHHKNLHPDQFTVESYSQYVTWVMEQGIRALSRSGNAAMGKITIVFDMDGFGFREHAGSHAMALGRAMISLTQDQYPERLRQMIAINYPRMFSGFWKLVRPWVDDKTRDKIMFAHDRSELHQVVPANMLPERLQ